MVAFPLYYVLIFFLLGIVIGSVVTWTLTRGKATSEPSDLVRKEVLEAVQQQANSLKEDLHFAEQEIRTLSKEHAIAQTELRLLQEKMDTQSEEIGRLQVQARLEFEQTANKLLEEKSQRFTQHNREQIDALLYPLREKIKDFETGIEQRFVEETKQRTTLQQEIQHLRELNVQLSHDANNLVNALKGDNKFQGDWGEFRLEVLLEKSGLVKELHYRIQPSFRDEEGAQKRPDFVINLPEGKHLIIDSKVSLAAYERFFNCGNDTDRQVYLAQHIDSLKRHIRDLSSKNYQQLYQINTPDYLLLFIPIEPAFNLANQYAPQLFLEALEQNIILVTSSTLLATMRTVAFIWKQERQKKNVLEIARQSGLLYDKFVGFVDDLKLIGQRLDDANTAYQSALNKLKDASRYGDTLIGRAEKIKELGAKTSKSLPEEWLETNENSESKMTPLQ